jgi:tRNA threonylcarbamoyladenosine biosynthesis protein TsaE
MSGRPTYTFLSRGEEQTIALGEALAQELAPGDVVALRGELGAGKTRLVRGIAAGLGHEQAQVSSPTFVVMHEYDDAGARMPLVHVDAYRLRGDEELANLGWDRVMNSEAVVVVEWAERVAEGLPDRRFDVLMEHAGGDERRIVITGPSRERVLESVAAFSRPRPCRVCGRAVMSDAATFPFCTERCRLIDLGKWATEDYRITREIKDSDVESGE